MSNPPLRLRGHRVCASQALLATAVALVVHAAPAQTPGQLLGSPGKQHLPRLNDETRAVKFGDVDGDGDLDLVCANGIWGAQNGLFLNDGAGLFTDATANRMPALAAQSRAVALGDVDGDGDLDLVFGNHGQNSLYVNDGLGTFTDASWRLPVDHYATTSVALGDVDGDGDLDLMTGNAGSYYYPAHPNRLYLNNGLGVFVDRTTGLLPPDTDRTHSVVLGDIDGDGDLDLICGNSYQDRLYLNNRWGSFTDATLQRMPADNDNTRSLALGDIDGDGDLDLVMGNHGTRKRVSINTAGIFSDASAAWLLPDNDFTTSVALGDVDRDGDLDLVCGNYGLYGQQNRLYLNIGNRTFQDVFPSHLPAVVDATRSVALGDVDGDGDLDLACGNSDIELGQQNRLCMNNGTGRFVDAVTRPLPFAYPYTHGVQLADLDRDGDLDLLCANIGNGVIRLNDGTGSFLGLASTRHLIQQEQAKSVAVGDVDGDGDLDIICGNYAGQSRLFLNNGQAHFLDASAGRMPSTAVYTRCVTLGDVDGDGDLDLILGVGSYFFGIPRNQQNRLFLNQGNGSFTDATASQMPIDNDPTFAVALGDVDGDGDLDLLCANDGAQSRLYLNNGLGRFTDATQGRLPAGVDRVQIVALGDVDGDSDLDAVLGGALFGQDRLLLNNGSGFFTDATATHVPTTQHRTLGLVLADLDGDGDLDLTVAAFRDRLFLNNGSGVFADATATSMPPSDRGSTCLAAGDVDGDGDIDLVFGDTTFGPNPRSEALLVNHRRHLEAPLLMRLGRPFSLAVHSHLSSPATDIALPYLSLTRIHAPIPPYGTLGIRPEAALPLVAVPQPAGVGTLTWTLPNAPQFIGTRIYAQAFLLHQQRFTNVTVDVANW